MGLPTGEIQTSAIARLRGDATLATLLGTPTNPPGSVFDLEGAVVNQAFPYLVCWESLAQDGMAAAIGLTAPDAADIYLNIDCFTQGIAQGFLLAGQLAARVHDLFHRKELTLTGGYTNFYLAFDRSVEQAQPDGQTQHIAIRFKTGNQG